MEPSSPRIPAAKPAKRRRTRNDHDTTPSGPVPGSSRMLSVKEIAERLGCSDDSVSRLINAGELTAVNIRVTGTGVRLRVSEAELERWIRARTLPAASGGS